jgi:hypothetical protein
MELPIQFMGHVRTSPMFKLLADKRLLFSPITRTPEVKSVAIPRGTKGDVTPAEEKFCEILRRISSRATAAKPKPARSF